MPAQPPHLLPEQEPPPQSPGIRTPPGSTLSGESPHPFHSRTVPGAYHGTFGKCRTAAPFSPKTRFPRRHPIFQAASLPLKVTGAHAAREYQSESPRAV